MISVHGRWSSGLEKATFAWKQISEIVRMEHSLRLEAFLTESVRLETEFDSVQLRQLNVSKELDEVRSRLQKKKSSRIERRIGLGLRLLEQILELKNSISELKIRAIRASFDPNQSAAIRHSGQQARDRCVFLSITIQI